MIQKLEARFDPATFPLSISDPEVERKVALSKNIIDCTIDEIIQYRADEIFPPKISNTPQRTSRISMYPDVYYFSAMRHLRRYHQMSKAGIRYLAIAVGYRKLLSDYAIDIRDMNELIQWIDENSDCVGIIDSMATQQINQESSRTKMEKVGFTEGEHGSIEESAEILGVSMASLIIICFWKMAITSQDLKPEVDDGGRKMIMRFEYHLKSRLADLRRKKSDVGSGLIII